MPDPQTHVIVGAALAGAKAAEALREEGFDGRIVLVGDEHELPYERPPLSKDYLRGESPREKARVHPDDFYGENDIDLRTATTVEEVDAGASEVALSTGERIGYDRLLLATGAEPRRLSVPGAELDGVHYLRTLADADRLAARLDGGGRLVVIGGGWIGAEVAASARQKGLDVTLVELSDVPLERVLGREVGEIYAAIHRDHGVEVVAGTAVEALEGSGRVERVRLAGGREVESDFVVAGIGVVPRTELAERAGIAVDDGIAVDERLETSVPGVFAAGDVANAFHPFYGRHIRIEHQYDVGMEYSGYATSWDNVVFRGDPAKREFIAFWLEDGRVVAGMNVNVWDVTDPIQRLIRERIGVDERKLADLDVPLEDLGR